MNNAKVFKESPSDMSECRFIDAFGGIYEHSPWVAMRTFQRGMTARHDTVEGLSEAMAQTLLEASCEEKLALIRAHPDLAGKEAVVGSLTAESTTEQDSAGLSRCTAAELIHLQTLNRDYRSKHGFPFVMAVRQRNRQEITACFEKRLNNDTEQEFVAALHEINEIAMLRLLAMATGQ